jgi:hypothetical protein
MIRLLAYLTIGITVGVFAARWEYRDGAIPGSILTAGAVGVFTIIGWPVVGGVLLIGWVAKVGQRERP